MSDGSLDDLDDLDELEEASYPLRLRFVMVVCQYSFLLYIALVLEMMLLTFAVFAAVFAEQGPAGATILLIDFVLLGVATVPTVGFLIVCNRRDPRAGGRS